MLAGAVSCVAVSSLPLQADRMMALAVMKMKADLFMVLPFWMNDDGHHSNGQSAKKINARSLRINVVCIATSSEARRLEQ